MLRYNQFRLMEETPPALPGLDLAGLEAELIRSIESQFTALKIKLVGQVRDSMRQNRGVGGKLKNWWGNLMHGTTGEATGPLELLPFADEQVLRELRDIMEGPIDQTIAQLTGYLDQLRVQIVATIRDGIRRVAPSVAPAIPQAPMKPARRRISLQDLEPHSSTTGSPGGDVSRIQTPTGQGASSRYATSDALPPELRRAPDPKEPEEPEEAPELEPELEPEPEVTPEVPEPEESEEDRARKHLTFGVQPKINRKAVSTGGTTRLGKPAPEKEAPPEDPSADEPAQPPDEPADEPKPQGLLRKRKPAKLGAEGPSKEALQRAPLSPEEMHKHHTLLRHWTPEVRQAYEAEDSPFLKRMMTHFLRSIRPEVLDTVQKGAEIPQVLKWIKGMDNISPDMWAKLAISLPDNPKILGDKDKFRNWAKWVMKEGVAKRTAYLIECLREQRERG